MRTLAKMLNERMYEVSGVFHIKIVPQTFESMEILTLHNYFQRLFALARDEHPWKGVAETTKVSHEATGDGTIVFRFVLEPQVDLPGGQRRAFENRLLAIFRGFEKRFIGNFCTTLCDSGAKFVSSIRLA